MILLIKISNKYIIGLYQICSHFARKCGSLQQSNFSIGLLKLLPHYWLDNEEEFPIYFF